MKIGDISYWRKSEESTGTSTSTFEMKSREAMVLRFWYSVSPTHSLLVQNFLL